MIMAAGGYFVSIPCYFHIRAALQISGACGRRISELSRLEGKEKK